MNDGEDSVDGSYVRTTTASQPQQKATAVMPWLKNNFIFELISSYAFTCTLRAPLLSSSDLLIHLLVWFELGELIGVSLVDERITDCISQKHSFDRPLKRAIYRAIESQLCCTLRFNIIPTEIECECESWSLKLHFKSV